MPETNFRPSSTVDDVGTLRIDAERITGQGGPVFPQLNVPLNISLKSADVFDSRKYDIHLVRNMSISGETLDR